MKYKFKVGTILGNYIYNPKKMLRQQYKIEVLERIKNTYKVKDLLSGKIELIDKKYLEDSHIIDGSRIYIWDENHLIEGQAHGKQEEAQLRPACSRRNKTVRSGTQKTSKIHTKRTTAHSDVPQEGRQDNTSCLGKTKNRTRPVQQKRRIQKSKSKNEQTSRKRKNS